MNFILKLFSFAVILIRAGEVVINLTSKLATQDYVGAILDTITLLSIVLAKRAALRRFATYLLKLTRVTYRKITSRKKRFNSKRGNNSDQDD